MVVFQYRFICIFPVPTESRFFFKPELRTMKKIFRHSLPEFWIKVFLWILIALYTYFLPEARRVYNAIVEFSGDELAGKVPLVLVAIIGAVYIFAVWRSQNSLRNLLFLLPCGLISFLIMYLVENPNKHIHIPQYVLMAWLLFSVLSRDYESRDIYFLIFIYASVLGVVDELEQGLHPSRFYGWIDMAVNSSSGLVGVFTIMGLRHTKAMDWKWTGRLKEAAYLIWLNILGIIGVILMCVNLFQVQTSGVFQGVYPIWLIIWSVLFLIISPIALVLYWRKLKKDYLIVEDPEESGLPEDLKITNLWIIPMLVILFYMHSLLVYLAISGVEFA